MNPAKQSYKQTFTVAIVFCKQQDGTYACKKYQWSIKYNQHYVSKFCNDMKRKFFNAEYVNFYNKETREFLERIYLE